MKFEILKKGQKVLKGLKSLSLNGDGGNSYAFLPAILLNKFFPYLKIR
jgi:hypothetical protein